LPNGQYVFEVIGFMKQITVDRIVDFTKKTISTRKCEGIQTKSSLLGVHNKDDGRKITIDWSIEF